MIIDSFSGEYAFLSNFYQKPFMWDLVWVATAEHAYQMAKTLDITERDLIWLSPTPSLAKRYGRKCTLREDWEDTKDSVMKNVITVKFQDPELKEMLLATGDTELIEGNTWGDTYWGLCNGKGKNMLGKLLMELREEIRNEE